MLRRKELGNRSGFTLVELLMVITIIGLLAGLATNAIWKAIATAKTTAVVFEIGQLDTAMKAMKEQTGQYPPDLSDISYTSTNTNTGLLGRANRFQNYLKFAFPRCTTAYTSYQSAIVKGSTGYKYNFNSGGSYQALNMDNMDQAEALVFWLGGFPTPYNAATSTPMGSRKLYGFHTDVTNPMRLDQPTGATTQAMLNQFRTQPKFDFDETRLVDNDGDGWLEYIPKLDAGSNGMTPPYVYFDSGAYTNWPTTTPQYMGYPGPLPNTANQQVKTQLLSAWGLAVPYATSVTAQSATQWINPISMQIICAGRDGMYSLNQNMRVPCYPSGTTYTMPGFSNPGFYDSGETDNLTNFSPGELQDQVPVGS